MTYIDYAMSNEDYHNKELHPHLSSSDIKEVEKTSPLHWALKLEQPRKAPTPAMLAGSAIHAMISEPEKELFVRGLPDRRKRTEWAKLEEQAAKKGQTVLTESEFDDCQRIADTAIDTCVELQAALGEKDLAVEASIFTECAWSGLKLKCRPDMMSLSKRTMWDIKTTTDNTLTNFPRDIKRWSYDIQAAFYLHCAACAGLVVDRFVFLAVDKPTGVCVAYELSELYLKHAEKRMEKVLNKLVEAESKGKFETGWERVNTIHLPSWMEDELDAF